VKTHFSIKDVQEIETRGPWRTKSEGNLMVLFSFPYEIDMKRFLRWDDKELKNIPDIRGLRYYSVRSLPKGQVGGGEFHRIRQEIVFATEGSVQWECEDLSGKKKITILAPQNGIWLSPFILHSYKVLEEGTGLAVIANTTFDPENTKTHDTFSLSEFQKLQKEHQK